eukprot:scaffold3166_cov111-Isochrysis_galbana.AAC.6
MRRSSRPNLSARSRACNWKVLHISTADERTSSSISTSARNVEATASSASAGHARNQSMVQQLTSEGNMRSRRRKASPMGDIARHTCKELRHRSMKRANMVVGEPSPSRPCARAASRRPSQICARSSAGKRLGTSPAFRRPLMSSRKTVPLPSRPTSRSTDLRSSRQSDMEYDLETSMPRGRLPARAADTGEQRIAAGHLKYAQKEDKLHGLGRNGVVVIEKLVHGAAERLSRLDALVRALALGIGKVAIKQTAHRVVLNRAIVTDGQAIVLEELGHGLVEVLQARGDGHVTKPGAVVQVGQAVVEDAIQLVAPAHDEVGRLRVVLDVGEENALYHTRNIPEVEGVVRLGWRGQQAGDRLLIGINCRAD